MRILVEPWKLLFGQWKKRVLFLWNIWNRWLKNDLVNPTFDKINAIDLIKQQIVPLWRLALTIFVTTETAIFLDACARTTHS